ncbi:FAD-dependent oxidoreductase [Mesorhizobium sp. SP-1A]|uniref:FAD-dependent oxidoreductase n=1 Tax=Mesorhizobium sp. SP-1A TaxID=3077840 RepID=UPI0028F71CD0|nr:FAD-dependent oxidoreductase [Mesorhizobium sp. SP-1A]
MHGPSGQTGSVWEQGVAAPEIHPPLAGSHRTESVVVGAGIVGLTAALRLLELGRPVIVLEGLRAGRQVSGRSSAKITTQHRLIYRHLIDTVGTERAAAYAEANSCGAAHIRRWIVELGIGCDLEDRSAYTYTQDPERLVDLEAEVTAAGMLGLAAEVTRSVPLPFATAGALRFPGQAQFNPVAYLDGLAQAVTARGGRICENSRVLGVDEAARWRATTAGGAVEADNIVIATNMTIKTPVGMAKRTQPRCHGVMAFRIADASAMDGMFITAEEPTYSFRTGHDQSGPILLALGPHFGTGHDGDVAARFIALEKWVRTHLPVGEALWRWCNEDYDTADRIPLVGEPDPGKAPGFHIATGFNAWGISNGTAAGLMIADSICGRSSPWRELYDPARPLPKDFHRDGESQSLVDSPEAIAPGVGGVIVHGDDKIALRRDDDGTLHALSARCTHKGCIVTWNNAERTWDCPCHGSIFAADGSVIHGPARKPLEPAGFDG